MLDEISETAHGVRPVGVEFRKSYARRVRNGFMAKYLSGPNILDIGYLGADPNTVPITETAIGITLEYPGYDGVHLPFDEKTQDAVLASHVLEHLPLWRENLADWYRVLKVGGHLIIFVPHQHLFERKAMMPSLRNGDHRRFYTPSRLLAEIEAALPINGYRVRHLADNDTGFPYDMEPDEVVRKRCCYEIELVVQRIEPPSYTPALTLPPATVRARKLIDDMVFGLIADALRDGTEPTGLADIPKVRYFPAWQRVRQRFVYDGAPELNGAKFTEEQVEAAVKSINVAKQWRRTGYFSGRANAAT
jgi:SAM-dependent methyltransferase